MGTPDDTPHDNDANGASDTYAAKLRKEVEQLKADKKALQDEMHAGDENTVDDDPTQAKRIFKKYVPGAITQIILLAEAADSESVKLNANKFIIQAGLSDLLSGKEAADQNFTNLLEKIKATK